MIGRNIASLFNPQKNGNLSRSVASPGSTRINPSGINNGVNGMSLSALNAQIPSMINAGIRYVRYEMVCADQNPAQNVFSFGFPDTDNKVNALVNNGFRIIALLDQYAMPAWMNLSGTYYPPTPANYQAWCTAVASHYAGKIDLFEMGNEPNFAFTWGPYPGTQTAAQAAAAYVALLQAGYNGIKAGNSNAKVISAGLGSVGTTDNNGIKTTDYITSMYANGCKGYYDYFGLHPYAQPDSDATFSDITANLDAWRTIMTTNTDTTHIILTELGWTTYTGGVSVAAQAANITSMFNAMMTGSYQYIDVFCLYNYINTGTDLTNHQQNYGILNNDLSQKSGYSSFVKAHSTFINSFSEIVI